MSFSVEPFEGGWSVSNGCLSFRALDFGCTLANLFVPDKNGDAVDVLLGFDSLEGWKNGTQAHNGIVGRFANRIAGARFFLDGEEFFLDGNETTLDSKLDSNPDSNPQSNSSHSNCLHGGFFRFEKQYWRSEPFLAADRAGVVFSRVSPAEEQHFPGNLELKVIYSLDLKNQLTLEYFAKTDRATPINLTNHAYFNLNGGGKVLDHTVCLKCRQVLKTVDMIPTGEFLDVTNEENSVFNFLQPKTVGRDLERLQQETGLKGYDHCFVTPADRVNEKSVLKAGWCRGDKSGIKMNIYTNQRGLQFYTGNFLEGPGKNGTVQEPFDGVCFEAQRFPDCMNHKNFPDCILRPGEEYWQKTVYEFLTEDADD